MPPRPLPTEPSSQPFYKHIYFWVIIGVIAGVTFGLLFPSRVLGTSSSESALPPLMAKLERAGCAQNVVGIVLPAGDSFNLDGTSIYLAMAVVFLAQATNTPLSLGQEFGLLALLLLTSKGAAAVTGGGFMTLAATLSAHNDATLLAGLAILLGVDRSMSEARAITNLIGNGLATLIIARSEGELDIEAAVPVLR